LALVVLARDQGAGHHWPDVLEQALYQAACHRLMQSVAEPFLTASFLAAELGCSRAQLYRVFAAHGTSVAGYLYELRMRRAARLLVERPGVAIGTIAMQCSYSGPIAFDKAFRRCFGMTPGDWRAERMTVQANFPGN
jgi:AraC-like DNA-binding protein